MAYITIVNGGAQPVFATDTLNGSVAQTANLAAQPVTNFQGPKLDFFSLTANAVLSAAGAGNANGYISNVLTSIQQIATVAMYQVSPAAPQTLNIALFPTGAYDAANLVAAAQTANVANNASFTTQPVNVIYGS